jgi:hypothetical protein
MEVALCLSGQPRLFKRGYKYIKNFLIDEYNIKDVFCHFWWDSQYNTQGTFGTWNFLKYHDLGHDNQYKSEGNVLNELIKLYNPIHIEYDAPPKNLSLTPEQVKFYTTQYTGKESIWENYPEEYRQYLYTHLKSIIDSQFQSSHFKRVHEQNKGKKYDLVVRTRYDFALNPKLEYKWKGKFNNLPSLEEIQEKLQENPKHFFTEWDNLWIYTSELHDKMMEGMWWDFDKLFNFIVSQDESNPFKDSTWKAIPEHFQGARAREIWNPFSKYEVGINCNLFIPRTEEEFNDTDLKWNL